MSAWVVSHDQGRNLRPKSNVAAGPSDRTGATSDQSDGGSGRTGILPVETRHRRKRGLVQINRPQKGPRAALTNKEKDSAA